MTGVGWTPIINASINFLFPLVAAVATYIINDKIKNQQLAAQLSNAVHITPSVWSAPQLPSREPLRVPNYGQNGRIIRKGNTRMSSITQLADADIDMVSGGHSSHAALVQVAHNTATATGGNGGTAIAFGGTANANGGNATANATSTQNANGNIFF
jgi:hypothetical protein